MATYEAVKTRVLLVDEYPLMLHALKELLQEEQEIEVIGHCHSLLKAAGLVQQLTPDVCIIDIGTAGPWGWEEVIKRMLDASPGTGVIVFTFLDKPGLALEALQAGARGYLLKKSGKEELLRAIRRVRDGKTYLCTYTLQALGRETEARPPGGRWYGWRTW